MAKTRPAQRIPAEHGKAIREALDRWADSGDLHALRLRAFVYLLWDGVVRSKVARSLNMEDVVVDPKASKIRLHRVFTTPPTVATRYREVVVRLSNATQQALIEYLKAVRIAGWIPSTTLTGPLFVSSRDPGGRVGIVTLATALKTFQENWLPAGYDYQLDDFVMAGRLDYLEIANSSVEALAEYADISVQSAIRYRRQLLDEHPKDAPKSERGEFPGGAEKLSRG